MNDKKLGALVTEALKFIDGCAEGKIDPNKTPFQAPEIHPPEVRKQIEAWNRKPEVPFHKMMPVDQAKRAIQARVHASDDD